MRIASHLPSSYQRLRPPAPRARRSRGRGRLVLPRRATRPAFIRSIAARCPDRSDRSASPTAGRIGCSSPWMTRSAELPLRKTRMRLVRSAITRLADPIDLLRPGRATSRELGPDVVGPGAPDPRRRARAPWTASPSRLEELARICGGDRAPHRPHPCLSQRQLGRSRHPRAGAADPSRARTRRSVAPIRAVAAIQRINSQLVARADRTRRALPRLRRVSWPGPGEESSSTSANGRRCGCRSAPSTWPSSPTSGCASSSPIFGRVAKALVVDLDNTLWGGVVGEDGLAGIQLGVNDAGAGFVALQRALASWSGRGILLGICSKNNEADALEVLERIPRCCCDRAISRSTHQLGDKATTSSRSPPAEHRSRLDRLPRRQPCGVCSRSPTVAGRHRDRVDRGTEVDRHPLIGNPFFERLALTTEDRVERRCMRNSENGRR